MPARRPKPPARRQPKQERARQTVEAILDAVVRIAKRDGVDAVTTNRIARVAGVSVGSVYQYFPDKRGIFLALHDRHVERVNRLVDSTLVERAEAPLDELLRALLDALLEAHAIDPELDALLDGQVPHRGSGERSLEARLRGALRLALAAHRASFGAPHELERALFVLAHMMSALAHGAVLERPRSLSLAAVRDEAVNAVLAYVRSW